MIYGVYRDDAPRVVLPVRGERDEQEAEFVLDTAFDGEISLPPEVLQRLGIMVRRFEVIVLGDGSVTRRPVHYARIEWLDGERTVETLSLATRPLLGTALLRGSHIDIEAVEGGSVLIEPMD